MIQTIKLENSTDKDMQICVEPVVDYIDWCKGKFLEIKIKPVNEHYNEQLDIVLTEHVLVVYEHIHYAIKIFIDKELKYESPEYER
jgi:hypothetical protein